MLFRSLDRSGISDSDLIRWVGHRSDKLRTLAGVGHVAANDLTWPLQSRNACTGEHALLHRIEAEITHQERQVHDVVMQPEGAMTADVGLVSTGGTKWLGIASCRGQKLQMPPKVGKNFLFAEPDPPRTKRFSKTFLCWPDHETALMFTMIYPFLWFLVLCSCTT